MAGAQRDARERLGAARGAGLKDTDREGGKDDASAHKGREGCGNILAARRETFPLGPLLASS